MTIDLAGFVRLSGDFTLGQSTLAEVTVNGGAAPEVLTNVPVLTIGAANGSVFVGINAGTPSEIGFTTTIAHLAAAIFEIRVAIESGRRLMVKSAQQA